MNEAIGDLWKWEPADVRVITTNGTVKKNGEAVMGRGCALEAKERDSGLPKILGALLITNGNHVFDLGWDEHETLVNFPVKHHWYEQADLALIARSTLELVDLADQQGWNSVVLPRAGCGNGKLKWDDVRPILELQLDERFTVITNGAEPARPSY